MLKLRYILFGLLIAYGALTSHARQPRIVNGSEAQLGEFPYQVALQIVNFTVCGGAIIDEYHILTAAHCVDHYGIEAKYYSVIVGSVDLDSKSNPGIRHNVSEIKKHEDFKYGNIHDWLNDIAVLRLVTPINFNDYAKPAVLPKSDEELKPGQLAAMTGFGRLNPNTKSTKLMKTEVYIDESSNCQKDYWETIRSTNVCVRPKRLTGNCIGDSGGPIIVDNKVVGVASFSSDSGCAGKSMKAQVYTRVSKYIDWINSHVK